MEEIWKWIPTWEGIFQCSNYGRVKRFYKHGEAIMEMSRDKQGYYRVKLEHNGRVKSWRIQRLVATVFHRPLLQTEDVHHKNHFKWCNCINNIQIVDHGKHQEEYHGCKSQETRRKISLSRVGFTHSQQAKKKISQSLKGRPCSQQTRRKRSESVKISWAKRKKQCMVL